MVAVKAISSMDQHANRIQNISSSINVTISTISGLKNLSPTMAFIDSQNDNIV